MPVIIQQLWAHRIHSVPGDVHCILQRLTAANYSRCVRSCSSVIARQKRLGNVRCSCERRVGKKFHTSVRFVWIFFSEQNIELRFVVAPWNKLCFMLTPIAAKHTTEVMFTALYYKPPSFITSTTKFITKHHRATVECRLVLSTFCGFVTGDRDLSLSEDCGLFFLFSLSSCSNGSKMQSL